MMHSMLFGSSIEIGFSSIKEIVTSKFSFKSPFNLLSFFFGKRGSGKNLGPDRTGKVRTSSDFGLQSELLHREELRTGSDRGVFIGIQSLLGISGVLMRTSDWAEKFGLRTGVRTFARLRKKLRTGSDWPRQRSDNCPESELHPPLAN